MTAITGRTGNLVGFSTGRGTTPWDTEMEAALRKMDAMLASTVVAITNTLPGSANEGDLYLVGTSPTGVAAGWANRIARWRGSPAGWEAYQPMQGWIITIVGESTNKVRRYNGTAWVALAADAGAEPYAGVPAATSFWRSTAAGVRAWVQLVAADITDLATTLAGYLTKANPAFTGTLTGGSAALTGSVDAGGEIKSGTLVGAGARPLVSLADGTIDDQDAAAFRGTISVPPVLSFTGSVDAKALNGGKTGLYRLAASTYTNFWTGIAGGQQASVLQLESPSGLGTLIASDNKAGGLLTRFRSYDVPGDGWSGWYTLWDSGNLPVGTTGRAVLATTTQAEARAAISAAKAPAKADVSASTTIGSIDATAIKVTATDVNLTLSGGVNGQGWDIINPTTSTGIAIPSGATLWKTNGFDVGPTTISLGGGRPIRITRIDANTWTMLGSQ